MSVILLLAVFLSVALAGFARLRAEGFGWWPAAAGVAGFRAAALAGFALLALALQATVCRGESLYDLFCGLVVGAAALYLLACLVLLAWQLVLSPAFGARG